MDENEFMAAVIEDMNDRELAAFCDSLRGEIDTPQRKEITMTKPTLYTQNGCGMCRAIHMLLDKKNIDYTEVIITPDNVEEFKAKGITATPTLEVDGHLYVKGECKDWLYSL